MLNTSQWINGKYRVIKYLSEGGTSYVYEVESSDHGSAVLKVAKQPTTLFNTQIDNEAKILAAVHHENVPELYDKLTIENYHHGIVMEKLEGERLPEIIERKNRQFNWHEVLDIAKQLAGIIYCFHHNDAPIVIRDIKPSNILLSDHNVVNLIDFGASVTFLHPHIQHKAIGTIGYAAPEQFENGAVDFRSDLFSFGATLFYITSGGKNIFTSNVKEIIADRLPKAFTDIILKLTETNVDDRYGSIDLVIKKLNKVRPTVFEYIFRQKIEERK